MKTRKKLVSKKRKQKSSILNGRKLFYSKFCLTDNLNFSEFHVYKKPLNYDLIEFDFNSNDLDYKLGDKINCIYINDQIVCDDLIVEEDVYLYFTKKHKEIEFYKLTHFLKEEVDNQDLIGLITNGTLVGILKSHEKHEGKENDYEN